MEITPRIARQIGMLTMILVIAPMVAFPEQFGSGLGQTSLINVLYELVFYAVVLFVLNRRANLIQLIQAGALCFVYRLVLGALFGLVISAMYSMNIRVSLGLGMAGYLPAVYIHVLAAPFILKPLLNQVFPGQPRKSPVREEPKATIEEAADHPRPTSLANFETKEAPMMSTARPFQPAEVVPGLRTTATHDVSSEIGISDMNGFDRTTRYIGEDGAVLVAAVVDCEGLLLSRFERGQETAEQWAPQCWEMYQSHARILSKVDCSAPERLNVMVADKKVVVSFDSDFCLMVVAERQMTDTLSIRMNQGMEIVRQYIASRYGQELFENAETNHVRSA